MSTAFLDATQAVRRGARYDEERAPYPWVMMPPGGISFFAKGSLPAPAYGTANQIELCSYEVQDNWEGVLLDVMNLYTDNAGTFVQGSGDIVWSIDIDRPLGSPLQTGRWLPDYFQIITQLGDLSEPWPVRGGWRMKQGETYRYKVYTVANVGVGAPNFVHAALLGWTWPMARQGV
jgi:hypothetical protein